PFTTRRADLCSISLKIVISQGQFRLGGADFHARRRLLDQRLGAFVEQLVEATAVDLLLSDLQQYRYRQRRDAVEAAVADAALHTAQHLAETADVGEAASSVGAGGLQQDVIRLVLAQHVVNEVCVEGHLAP